MAVKLLFAYLPIIEFIYGFFISVTALLQSVIHDMGVLRLKTNM